ncbi:copper resistance protein CopC [Actinoplanes oblitus]|uniref:Copper resistance protein CopC n=1 Tax=Actinoplanes oblitus TaxID=3040509 RepID=A0ABY8WCR5_9ACTN|nr:copper resistance CopC family protein [Actinoplanes oblitus]WIM94199.1 copper resistance protein CopC [Actinoplanes oblitus]
MTKRLLLALAATLTLLIPAAPAWAHNALVEATPAKNATLTKAPAAVKLRFLEKLPDTTKMAVTGADGSSPEQSPAAVSGKTISVTFPEPLPNGVYTVEYQVAAEDGHVTESSYKFTVAVPGAATSAPASATPAAPSPAATTVSAAATIAAEPAGEDSGGFGLGLAAGIGVLLLAGAAGFVLIRRRATRS